MFRLLALGAGTLLLAGFIAYAVGRAIAKPVAGRSRFATCSATIKMDVALPRLRCSLGLTRCLI
jgi:hypothetical protein